MARTREFDRDEALAKATEVFWRTGFAATSTETLLSEMGIGRQSLYNAFGDKRTLYLEVLQTYQSKTLDAHLARLDGPSSPRQGIRDLLAGVAVSEQQTRQSGCLGVASVGEFGTSDKEILAITARANRVLAEHLTARIEEGKRVGEFDDSLESASAVEFVLHTMSGLAVSARAGANVKTTRRVADFAVGRL